MTVKLNHTIVSARDKRASAAFMSEILGLPAPTPFGPFLAVQTGNEVTLDFMNASGEITPQHYAFLIDEAEFDAIFGRVKAAGLVYGSTPWSAEDGKLNDWGRGRGVYFKTPDGHLLELMTVPQ